MQKQSLKGTITVNGKHFGVLTLPIDGEEVGAVMQIGKVAGKGAKVVGFFTETQPFDTDRFSVWVNKAGRIIVSSEAVVRVNVGETPKESGFKAILAKVFTGRGHDQKEIAASTRSIKTAYQTWRTAAAK